MKPRQSRLRTCVTVAALFFALPALAGKIDFRTAGAGTQALFDGEAKVYIDAQRMAYDAYRTTAHDEQKTLSNLRNKASSDVLARIDYSWTDSNGIKHTRHYHSRAGGPIREQLADVENRDSGFGSGLSDEGNSQAAYDEEAAVRMDADETIFYIYGSSNDVRASILPARDSLLHSTAFDNQPEFARANDAELKAFRMIEADMNKKIVPKGGEVIGYVNKEICASCSEVIRTFAREYDASGTIYQLLRPSGGHAQADSAQAAGSAQAETAMDLPDLQASARALKGHQVFRRKYAKEHLGAHINNVAPRHEGHKPLERRNPRKMADEDTRSPDISRKTIEGNGC